MWVSCIHVWRTCAIAHCALRLRTDRVTFCRSVPRYYPLSKIIDINLYDSGMMMMMMILIMTMPSGCVCGTRTVARHSQPNCGPPASHSGFHQTECMMWTRRSTIEREHTYRMLRVLESYNISPAIHTQTHIRVPSQTENRLKEYMDYRISQILLVYGLCLGERCSKFSGCSTTNDARLPSTV